MAGVRKNGKFLNSLADPFFADLMTNPFFEPGDSSIEDLYDASLGSAFAQSNHPKLISEMIPALSLAAGLATVGGFGSGRNFDMQNSMETGWPSVRLGDPDKLNKWLHSDFRNVGYPYVYTIFDEFVNLGGLNQ